MKKRQIRYVDLSDNPLGAKGVQLSIIPPQARTWTLLTVNISRCRMGAPGGTVIGNTVANSSSQIQHLNVSGNSLGDEGLMNFAEALKKRQSKGTLRSLE